MQVIFCLLIWEIGGHQYKTVLNGHARITESAKEVVIMTGDADRHSGCQRRICRRSEENGKMSPE